MAHDGEGPMLGDRTCEHINENSTKVDRRLTLTSLLPADLDTHTYVCIRRYDTGVLLADRVHSRPALPPRTQYAGLPWGICHDGQPATAILRCVLHDYGR